MQYFVIMTVFPTVLGTLLKTEPGLIHSSEWAGAQCYCYQCWLTDDQMEMWNGERMDGRVEVMNSGKWGNGFGDRWTDKWEIGWMRK